MRLRVCSPSAAVAAEWAAPRVAQRANLAASAFCSCQLASAWQKAYCPKELRFPRSIWAGLDGPSRACALDSKTYRER
eukprot:1773817-Pyramimonas_sp.AAC.1